METRRANTLDVTVQNTRSRSQAPGPAEEHAELDAAPRKAVTLRMIIRGDVFLRTTSYPVIVEMWEKVKSGRRKLQWLETFTEHERKLISRWYGRFYDWHLRTGTPQEVSCTPATLTLLQRAAAFFGTL